MSSKNNLLAYGRFVQRFFDELQPNGIIEVKLVQTVADCSWRLNCARIYENNLFTLGAEEQAVSIDLDDPEIHNAQFYRAQTKTLAAISMHEQRVSREFRRSLTKLRKIQDERRKEEHRQSSKLPSSMNCANEAQQAAGAGAQNAAQSAASGAANEPTTPYDATKDGFVLTNEEIETYIRREDRKTGGRVGNVQPEIS